MEVPAITSEQMDQWDREVKVDVEDPLLLALADLLLGDADPDLPAKEIAAIRDGAPESVKQERSRKFDEEFERYMKGKQC